MKRRRVPLDQLGGRARQVLDLLYRNGSLTAGEVLEALPDLPTYSAARSVLRALEAKGLAAHTREGARYIYRPTAPHRPTGRSVIRYVVETFFYGSTVEAMQALVAVSGPEIDKKDLEELRDLIARAERRIKNRGEP